MKLTKKHLFLILIIAAHLPLSINSQSTFMKSYGVDGDSTEDIGYTVLQTDDGGYLAGGVYNQNIQSAFKMSGYNFLVKTNKDGETLWTKTYGDPLTLKRVTTIFKSNDGGYFVFYLRSWTGYLSLMKINSEGDSLWTKGYQFRKDIWQKSLKHTKDNGFVIIGKNKTSRDILKLDSVGNVMWEKTYDLPASNFVGCSVAETIDGGYIISNTSYSSIINSQHIWIIKTDDSLNTQWRKEYPPPGDFEVTEIGPRAEAYQIIQTSDSGYFNIGRNTRSENCCETVTRGWLIKTDSKGDTLWTKLLGLDIRLYSGFQTSDGCLIAAGQKGISYLYIIKLNPNGTIIWEREIGIEMELGFRPFDIKETNDGGYIITGHKYTNFFDYQDLFLMKVNKDGILVSVKSEKETIPTNFELTQNYPNPFNPTTTIRYKIPTESFVKIKIYNALGEEVRTLVNEVQKDGIYEVQFIPGNIASGIYFYTLQTEQNVLSRKMIYVK